MKEQPKEQPFARTTNELREDVEASKEALAGTIRQLDRQVKRASDWRVQVHDHPFLTVGTALAAGGLLALLFRRKPTPQERLMDAIADTFEDFTLGIRNRVVGNVRRSFTRGLLKSAGTALVTRAAAQYAARQFGGQSEFVDDPNENNFNEENEKWNQRMTNPIQ